MKYLYIMGGSGCGKTTLAVNLDKWDKKTYKRIIQTTTREKREEEKEGVDYFFLSEEKFNKKLPNAFETVEYQFLPKGRYAAYKDQLDKSKWNIIVVSIEGFFSALNQTKFNDDDELILVNIINNCDLDVEREDRDPKAEENLNLGILRSFMNKGRNCLLVNRKLIQYTEIQLSDLKKYRENSKETLENFKKILERF